MGPGLRRDDTRFVLSQKRRPVGGDDRAPACQKRLGEIRTRRGNGAGYKRAWRPLRFWMLEVGIEWLAQNAIRACDIGKNAYGKQELCRFRAMLRGVLSRLPRKLHGRLAQTR